MRFKEFLIEARRTDLSYTEKQVKKVLSRVDVELAGNDSGVVSRLAKRYQRLDLLQKSIKPKRDELNAQLKEQVAELFDAEDAVLTRVVNTVSFTITLSKAEKADTKEPKMNVDYEAAYMALFNLVPELEEKLNSILEAYTSIIPAVDTPEAIRVKSKVDEGIIMDLGRGALGLIRRLVSSIKSWSSSYDKKLKKIEQLTSDDKYSYARDVLKGPHSN